ncbi:MAG: hypothetical protein A2583_14145 [Bdellovibrionales bacterium RIFOXYD1_FULL_53_11]|nr:MAG: hypothetical protein A2583_14145 [Bdellovibrionales bacterium RIFOXYD1_FULL_53_11]
MKVLFIGKKDDFYCEKAKEFTLANFPDCNVVMCRRGDSVPEIFKDWAGDYIFNYLAQWVIPPGLLKRARIAAINFHPGPPEYPGIGCTNYAVYEKARKYGVTCHHMDSVIDSGKIIAVKRFDVFDSDSVFTITQRAYVFLLACYFEIISMIVSGAPLPQTNEAWTRRALKRSELEALCRVSLDMSPGEVLARIKSTTYPNMPGVWLDVDGRRYRLVEDDN